MALPAGRVGVAPDQVDRNGNIKLSPPSPVAKGMFYKDYEVGEAYSYDLDALNTFIIKGSASNNVNVTYTPTPQIGPMNLEFNGIPAEGGNMYDYIFTLWVPKNVTVQVEPRNVPMQVITTIF